MGIDSSIYFQQQATPDVMGAIQNGMKMRDMIRNQNIAERQDNTKLALNGAIEIGPDGVARYNPARLSDIVKRGGDPQMVMQAQQQAAQQQAQLQDMDFGTLQKKVALGSQLLGSIKDDRGYQLLRPILVQHGIYHENELPKSIEQMSLSRDGFPTDWLAQHQTMGIAADKRMELKAKQQTADAATQTAQAKTEEARAANRKADAEFAGLGIKKREVAAKEREVSAKYPLPPKIAGGGEIDPAQLVPSMVPEHHQAKALSEIEAAQNTTQNAPKILEAFDNAAQNLHAVDFVPWMQNADQKSLHALLGPTFKDVEGTVRQAAMDNMNNNVTPQFGDSAETLAKKRSALIGYLQSKASAPTAKAYGLDLSKYGSTSIKASGLADGGSPQTIKIPSLQDLDAEIARRQPVAKGGR